MEGNFYSVEDITTLEAVKKVTIVNHRTLMQEAFIRVNESPEALCARMGWPAGRAKGIRKYLDRETSAMRIDNYITVMNALNRDLVEIPAESEK